MIQKMLQISGHFPECEYSIEKIGRRALVRSLEFQVRPRFRKLDRQRPNLFCGARFAF